MSVAEQNHLDDRFVPLNRILRRQEVMRICGIGQTLLYSLISEGEFPRQINLGGKAVGWVDTEVQQWIEDRMAARDQAS